MRFARPNYLFVAIAAVILIGNSANAAFTFNITQSGLNILVTGAGSINTVALTLHSIGSDTPSIFPAQAVVVAGPTSPTACGFYTGISGPARIGTGEYSYEAAGSGDVVGTGDGTTIELPSGYVSGTLLSDNATISSETLSYVGLTSGSYVYIWGSGPTADSLTINIGTSVPEPVSLAMIALPLGVAQLRRRRGRGPS